MAVDSSEKRLSAAGVPFLPLGLGVTPDATPGIEWRFQVAWLYSGVAVVAGGLVCADVSLTPRVTATVTLTPRVTATAGLEDC
jgi:hypothetical protein